MFCQVFYYKKLGYLSKYDIYVYTWNSNITEVKVALNTNPCEHHVKKIDNQR